MLPAAIVALKTTVGATAATTAGTAGAAAAGGATAAGATAATATTAGTAATSITKVNAALQSAQGMFDQFKDLLDAGRNIEDFPFGSSTISLSDEIQERLGLPSIAGYAGPLVALVERILGREPGMDQSGQSGPSMGG